MKIIILPGVGFHSEHEDNELIRTLKCNFDVSYYNWKNDKFAKQHTFKNEDIKFPSTLPWLDFLRRYYLEIIKDFYSSVTYGDIIDVPKADVYIGHSAGSIIALCQRKQCITFGSPLGYLPIVCNKSIQYWFDNNKFIYNIINEYDVIASEFTNQNITTYKYKSSVFSSFLPWIPHSNYWNNKTVISSIVKKLTSIEEYKTIESQQGNI